MRRNPYPALMDEEEESQEISESLDGSDSEEISASEESTTPNSPSAVAEEAEEEDDNNSVSESKTEEEDDSPDKDLAAASIAKPKCLTTITKIVHGSGEKRRAEIICLEDSNRASKKVTFAPVNEKKQLFKRLWDDNDEQVLLKGMVKHLKNNGIDGVVNFKAFHLGIKDSLHVQVTDKQLKEKIRRLKKKFINNARKEKAGKQTWFSQAHDKKIYNLSKKIWAAEYDKLFGLESSSNTATNANESILLPKNLLPVEKEMVVEGLKKVEYSKRLELEKKWEKLYMEEMEFYLKKAALLAEQNSVVLESIKRKKWE